MGKLSCGCDFSPDQPITPEFCRKHYYHTLGAIVVWELMRRSGVPQGDEHLKLSQARIDVLEAIEKLYPEVKEVDP